MDAAFITTLYEAHRNRPACPAPGVVAHFFERLLSTLFPGFAERALQNEAEVALQLEQLRLELEGILCTHRLGTERNAEIAERFMAALPEVYRKLHLDVRAIYEGDPAAKSLNEVIRTYPGFLAIAAYRVAHEIHRRGVLLLPRMITEWAHSKTGIDIHPAARIGEHFCIDHGTGVVIGETTEIGAHVKLFQGVTLGALSVRKEDAERKRHPTIEDHVVVYAGATILGGETRIGHHSTLGGNVWVTRSVPPYTKVYYQARAEADPAVDRHPPDRLIYKT
ncbi:MAG: serine O-acetyltransferase EpsC [Catalinimonas sp.]